MTLAVLLVGALQLGIAILIVTSYRRRNVPALVNAVVSFIAVPTPFLLEYILSIVYGIDIAFGPWLPLWVGVLGLFHSYGMLGPYDSMPRWDWVTHTLAGALAAAIVYAMLLVVVDHHGFAAGWGVIAATTVGLTLLVGIGWELIELLSREIGYYLDVAPILVVYGRRDTALDLLFDVVGAMIVLGLDLRVFVPPAQTAPNLTTTVLVGGATAIGIGSLLLALVVVWRTLPRR